MRSLFAKQYPRRLQGLTRILQNHQTKSVHCLPRVQLWLLVYKLCSGTAFFHVYKLCWADKKIRTKITVRNAHLGYLHFFSSRKMSTARSNPFSDPGLLAGEAAWRPALLLQRAGVHIALEPIFACLLCRPALFDLGRRRPGAPCPAARCHPASGPPAPGSSDGTYPAHSARILCAASGARTRGQRCSVLKRCHVLGRRSSGTCPSGTRTMLSRLPRRLSPSRLRRSSWLAPTARATRRSDSHRAPLAFPAAAWKY